MEFEAVAWNNGKHHQSGAGYGLRISPEDRNRFFRRSIATIKLVLPNGVEASININKSSFWNDTCRELISVEIGRWLLSTKLAPWLKGSPPRVRLRCQEVGRYEVLAH